MKALAAFDWGYIWDHRQVLFEGAGLSAEIVSQDPPATAPPAYPQVKGVKLKITAAANAPPAANV